MSRTMTPDVAGTDAEQIARLALDQFGIAQDARIDFVKYRENHVFRVRSSAGDWALKLHRPGLRTDPEIVSEAAVLHRLIGEGIRVVEPVRTLDGGHLARVRCPDDPTIMIQATVQRWLPGTAAIGDSVAVFTGGDRPGDGRLEALGRLTARLHDHAERRGFPAGYDRPAWDAAGLVGDTSLWGRASGLPRLSASERRLLLDAEERLSGELTGLSRDPRHYGAIHADLTVENVLADEEGLIVIDFDDSGTGWYLFDLTTSYFFASHHPDSTSVLESLMSGYCAERQLDAEDLVGWHPLLLARALSYLGWSVDRPGDPATVFHEQELLPWILDAADLYLRTGSTGWGEPILPTPSRPHSPSHSGKTAP